MEPGAKVRAIFDFIASAPDELPLHVGDVILVEQKVDHNWLIGSCNNQSGTFPANFVEPVEASRAPDRFERGQKVVAVDTFIGTADGDLSFQKGDIIEVTKQIDDNWLEGRLGVSTGIFPISYVTEHDMQHHVSTPGDILQARALTDNCGQLKDELSFHKNDIITIVEKVDEDWYRGMLHEKTGILPALCIEILGSGDGGKRTSPDLSRDGIDCNSVNGRLPNVKEGCKVPESSSKMTDSIGVSPCAKAIFPFIAEHAGEISLMDGDLVNLRRRIDDNWLEGEVGGRVGIFPSNYVQIQVDIHEGYVAPEKPNMDSSSSLSLKPQSLSVPSSSAQNNLDVGKWKGKRVKVLFDFAAVTDQDLGLKQGEIIQIIEKVDEDWFEAKHPSGRTGFVPVNYVKILEKPKSPSSKRRAPQPPTPASSVSTQNGSATSEGTMNDLLDIFSSTSQTSVASEKPEIKAKPPLPPKTAKVLAADKSKTPSAVDDLLCFDPLSDNLDDASSHIPSIQPLKPQVHQEQVGFKLGGGSYRPVSFIGKQSSQEDATTEQSTVESSSSNIKSTDNSSTSQPRSLMDSSPTDKPNTSILAPLSAPLSPPPPTISSQTVSPKPPLQKKSSYELLTAKPFSATTVTHIHSISRPGRRESYESPASPKSSHSKDEFLTLSQVNQEFDRALSGEETLTSSGKKFNPFRSTDSVDVPSSETLPPVPPRQPSPNPFSAEEKPPPSELPPPLPPRQPSPNPFQAESPPPFVPPSENLPPFVTATVPIPPNIQQPSPIPAANIQLPSPLKPSNPLSKPPNPPSNPPNPPSNPPSKLTPVSPQPNNLLRDDSLASDFSDDYLTQNINFSIRPSNSDFQAPTAFKLPPPPTKSKLKTSVTESPKTSKKFNPKSVVPRPRGRSSDGEITPPLYSHPQDIEFPQSTSADTEQFQKDLQSFQASVQQMFDPSQFEADDITGIPQRTAPPPPDTVAIATDQTASLLDGDFDVFLSDSTQPASLPKATNGEASVSDILGLGLGTPPPPTGSKVKAVRTPPARPKDAAPKRKMMPPRPAPPRFRLGFRTAEDELLAKLRPEGDNDMDSETRETVNALQGNIGELKAIIATQQEQKRVYEQMLQTASTEEIPDMEQQLTDCIATIENLQTELRSLEANGGDQLDEVEVQPRPAPESKMSVADFRKKVVTELVKTEQDYVRDIKLCQEGFMTVLKEKEDIISAILTRQQLEENERTGDKKPTKGLELDILFGNMEQVIETSESFLKDLEETTEGKAPEEQFVGQVFMTYSSDLHRVYAEYCRNHDDATALIEKYEENAEVQEYINQGLELVRQSTNCWDLASFLIKPVQRILKYQLLLGELDKYTEDGHADKPNLQESIQTMTEVAKAINEFKRRKDLVMKYRRTGQEAISDKLGRINLHSLRKKSQRINQRFTQMTGLTTQTVDGDFDQMERRFRNLEKTIRIYVKDINTYLEQLKEATSSEASVGSDISDYYASQSNLHEVNKYEAVQRHLANKLYKDYTLFVQQRVISPLNGLLIMFQGPHKLIQKRYDKLLDYDSFSNKLEKNKDKDRVKQHKGKEKEKDLEDSDDDTSSVGSHKRTKEKHRKELKEDKDVAKKNYEALNVQLKDELPKLCDMGISLFKSCVVSFVEAERDHINSTLKKLYPLLELSIVTNNSVVDIMKTFETSHMSTVEDIRRFSFVPKSLDKKGDRRSVYGTGAEPTPPPSAPRPAPESQSKKLKDGVNSRYPANRVFEVSADFNSQQPMDMSVKKGDLVGIIKDQDPTGSGNRWYVDNGASQGFIPSSILKTVGGDTPSQEGYGSDDDWAAFTQMQQEVQYYYAEWEFVASAENELTVAERDVVQLISDQDVEGNSEWWFVDKNGQRGYVPSAYLAKID